jgi:hypothetical protein
MAFFDTLLGFLLIVIIGGSVGAGFSKVAMILLRKQDKVKLLQIIDGKAPNILELDGEKINVDKFNYKDNSGKMFHVKFNDKKVIKIKDKEFINMVNKSSVQLPNEQKPSPLKKLKDKLQGKFMKVKK